MEISWNFVSPEKWEPCFKVYIFHHWFGFACVVNLLQTACFVMRLYLFIKSVDSHTAKVAEIFFHVKVCRLVMVIQIWF